MTIGGASPTLQIQVVRQNRYVISVRHPRITVRGKLCAGREPNTTLRTMLCEALRIAEVARYAARVSLVSMLLRVRPQLLIKL